MSTIQIRTDEAVKIQSGEIFRQLGVSMSDAINMFLRQSIIHGGFPFEIKLPRYNAETRAAIEDMEHSKGKGVIGKDVKSALAELKDGDDE